jgi:heme a synthase
MKVSEKAARRFRRWSLLTVGAVYLLILVGGIVRSTGSGMGCPDWPKCFGSWVPPTEVSQLPEDYRDIYAQKRKVKNEKLAAYLRKIGQVELADKISNDPAIYYEALFNPTKTWIEYLNRLIGVLIGFFIFLTLIFSLPYRKNDPVITYLSLASFLLVGFQGWLGSIVVSTNLLPGILTVHMLLALAIVCLLIWATVKSFGNQGLTENFSGKNLLQKILLASFIISLTQIILGTQVREGIDWAAKQLGENQRMEWVDSVGIRFYVHRSFSWLVVGSQIWVAMLVRSHISPKSVVTLFANSLLYVVGIAFVSGVAMAYLAIPAILQPLHLLLGNLIIGLQFAMLLWLHPGFFGLKKNYLEENQKVHF